MNDIATGRKALGCLIIAENFIRHALSRCTVLQTFLVPFCEMRV
jgi:hypothetical protein